MLRDWLWEIVTFLRRRDIFGFSSPSYRRQQQQQQWNYIRVTTNVNSRLGDLVVVMELPWKRESSGLFLRVLHSRASETKVEGDKIMSLGGWKGVDGEKYIDQLWLLDRKFRAIFLSSPLSLFHPLFTVCARLRLVLAAIADTTSDPSAVPRARSKFRSKLNFRGERLFGWIPRRRSGTRDVNPPTIAWI